MHRRILFGVAAWLLGAATATAGSLLAVSLLGQGITGSSGPLLTQDAVNRTLASESAEPSATAGAPGAAPSASASATRTAAGTPTATWSTPASSQTVVPTPTPSAPAAENSTAAAGTVLTSRGGSVVASCLAAGAYLNSWSPSQGYDVGTVYRGPAATARVTFESGGSAVTMVVSCSAGVPSVASYTHEAGDD